MLFRPTVIPGVMEVSPEWHQDERGAFGRIFCQREFAEKGLNPDLAQCSLSTNLRRGTVRGLHLQTGPHQEAKLVHCIAGRIYDVALDLRPGSATYGRYHALELSPEQQRMLYIPEGCAHGFQTLEHNTAVLYYISVPYEPASGRGVRWSDPAIGVPWPLLEEAVVSERDRALPLLADYRSND
jgi:dTDP-4-dehydrorhamnose 3,5-epimerase